MKVIQFKKAKRSLVAAFAFAATATFAAAPDALIHRWSFNNSLEDTGSLSGTDPKTAVLGGNAALTDDGTSVRVNAGGNGTSWVELGANPIPSDLGDTPFTIEVWATPTEIKNYASVFSLGARSDYNVKGLMGVFHGYRQIAHDGSGASGWGSPVWQTLGGKVNNGNYNNVGMAQGGISTGTPYYFAYVVMPKGDGTSATVIGYVYNASTGELVGKSGVYTATDWTTVLMVQSTFNLGTTPWDNDNPGADYDEVRVWKKALTPGQIAANLLYGPDALPGESVASATRLRAETATLAHRWSFNGSLKDSVTGDESATMKGGFYAADGSVRFAGGNKGDNEVALGANKMPSDSVTLEFFSTTRSLGWQKLFCLGNGSSTTDGISFSYQRGGDPDAGMSGLEIYDKNGGHYVNGIPNALEAKKPYHFTFTFSCDGTDTVVNGYCIDLTNPGVIRGQFSRTISGWKLREKITLNTFNLGWSFWGDGAPDADFDEVRVWNGVLSEAEVLKSAAAGADAAIVPASAAPDALIHRWSFNNSLEDTGAIGGMTAVLGGNAALHGDTSVRVNQGGNNYSYVELGANPIPTGLGDTPFTIEVWATPTALETYASVFALGERSDSSAKGLMGVFSGFRQVNYTGGYGGDNGPVWQALGGNILKNDGTNGGTGQNVAMTPSGISIGTPYYFAYVVTPWGNGSSATVVGYVYNASTGEQVGKSAMYSATGWTTALLRQSTFNLGTTPWNNNGPGADYDEVRVWKKALTPGQIAANVAAGPDAVHASPAAAPARILRTKSATLAHRWGFNGSLEDSVAGGEATMQGAFYSDDGCSVRFDGTRSSDYVALGADKIPSDSVTLEFFSTTRNLGWPKLFCLGSSSTDGVSFTYRRCGSDDNAMSGLEIYNRDYDASTGSGHYVDRIPNPLEANTPYLFTFTFSCDGTDTIVKGYCIDLRNPGTIRGQFTRTLAGWKLRESVTLDKFNIGWSFWGDDAPAADFDEVRVWDGVLTEDEILRSAAVGADAAINPTPDAADGYLHWVQSTGSQYVVLPGVTGRTGTKIQAVISGFGGGGQVLVGSHSSVGHISWKDDGDGWVGMGYRDKTNWGLNGYWNKFYDATGKGTLTSQISPLEFTLDLNGNSTWYNDSFNPNKLSDSDKTAYDTGLDMYVFALNDNGTAANRASCKLYSLKIWQTATADGTGDYALVADLRPYLKDGEACLYDEVSSNVLFSASVTPLIAGPVVTPHPSGCLMDYTFTSGAKSYSGTLEDPVTTAPGYTAVHGVNGYGTAVHAAGYAINNEEIKTTLAGEWTLATSFKSCDIEKGVLLSLGNLPANGTKQLAILSSSTEGRLYAAVVQRYGNDTTWVNRSLDDQTIAVSGADFTKEFHTLVVTHVPTDATHTGVLTVYVDGVQVHQFTTVGFASERAFGNGFRFGALMDNGGTTFLPSDIKPTAYNPDVAFQNVRLYGKALSAEEITAYAAEFPAAAATKGDIDAYGFRHDFSSGKLVSTDGTFVSTGGFNDNGLVGMGTMVLGPQIGGRSTKAAFPSKDGYGTIVGADMNGDWTLAMHVKAPKVADDEKGVMVTLGGVAASGTKAFVVSSTTNGLHFGLAQRFDSGTMSINTCDGQVVLTGLGDTTKEFHSLVVVHASNLRSTNDSDWKTGTYAIYWDGVYKGAVATNDGRGQDFGNFIKYGSLHDRMPEFHADNSHYPHYTEAVSSESGLAFYDLRFIPRVWTGAEAKDYAAKFPVAKQAAPGTVILLR